MDVNVTVIQLRVKEGAGGRCHDARREMSTCVDCVICVSQKRKKKERQKGISPAGWSVLLGYPILYFYYPISIRYEKAVYHIQFPYFF